MGVVIILLLLALAVYERETFAAVAFSAVLLFCLQPQYSPPLIHAGNTATSLDDLDEVHAPEYGLDSVIAWNGSEWVVRDGQVLTSDCNETYTFEAVDYNRLREQHRDSLK